MSSMPIPEDLLAILVCPESRAAVVYHDGALVSTDAATRRSYRIEGDIPVMLIEESEVLEQEAWQAVMDATGSGAKPSEA